MSQFGIATVSLGTFTHHSLPSKIAAASKAGFSSIELFDQDWFEYKESFAKLRGLEPSKVDGDETSILAAKEIRRLCDEKELRISCFQPLRDFEGYLDEKEMQFHKDQATQMISLLPHFGTDLLLVPSNTCLTSPISSSTERIVSDLRWLADEASKLGPGYKVCYEALAWGRVVHTWQKAFEIVNLVDRANFGCCFDTFNHLGRTYASPYTSNGLTNNYDLEKDLEELSKVPAEKIFFVQVADAARKSPPLQPPTDPTVPIIRDWSRSSRLFPFEFELGAYLPVDKWMQAILKTGFSGDWSLEVFNDSLKGESEEIVQTHAERGIKSLKLLEEKMAQAVNPFPATITRISSRS